MFCFLLRSHLSAEVAEVLSVLRDLHLLDGLTEGGTVTGTVLADDSDLLGALGLEKGQFRNF